MIQKLVYLFFLFIFFAKTSYASVVINEIMPNPAGDDKESEWIELYNTDHTSTTIDGYILEDKNGKRITLSGNFSDWFVIYPKGEHSFALTNSGSTIKLFSASTSAEPISTFSYSDSDDNESWGRIPDGEGDIKRVEASKGNSNILATPTPFPTPKPTATPKPTVVPTVKSIIPSSEARVLSTQSPFLPVQTESTVAGVSVSDNSPEGQILATATGFLPGSDEKNNQVGKNTLSFSPPKWPGALLVSFGGVLLITAAVFLTRQISHNSVFSDIIKQ